MPVHFFGLLQDSWNFMRNRPHFTLYGVGLLFGLQLTIAYLLPAAQLSETQMRSPDALEQAVAAQILPTMLSGVISVFVNILLILNIKSINNGNYQHFFQHSWLTFSKLLPVIALTLVMALPLSMAIAFGGTAAQSGNLALLILPLMITGIYVFLKLCLAVYTYLIEGVGISDALKQTWQLTRGRMLAMLLFCLLSYLVPNVLSAVATQLGGSFGVVLGQGVNALLNLFVVIFTFRFYQALRSKPISLNKQTGGQ